METTITLVQRNAGSPPSYNTRKRFKVHETYRPLTLTRDVAYEIFKHLHLQDLLRLKQVSKGFNRLASNDYLWHFIYENYFYFRIITSSEQLAWEKTCRSAYCDTNLYKIIPSAIFSLRPFNDEKVILHNNYVATTIHRTAIQVWDLSQGERPLYHLQGNLCRITCLDMNNEHVIAGVGDAVIVWNLNQPTNPICLCLPKEEIIYSVTIQGHHILAGTFQGTIERWDLSIQEKHCPQLTGMKRPIANLSTQGQYIYAQTLPIRSRITRSILSHSILKIWDLFHSSKPLYHWKSSKAVECFVLKLRIVFIAFDNGTIKAWDVDNLKKSIFSLKTDEQNPRCLAIDHLFLAAGFANGHVKVWDLTRPQAPLFCISHKSAIQDIVIQNSRGIIFTRDQENIYETPFQRKTFKVS